MMRDYKRLFLLANKYKRYYRLLDKVHKEALEKIADLKNIEWYEEDKYHHGVNIATEALHTGDK
jgi:hypothetical protein